MKRLFKYLFVFLFLFTFLATSAFAAKKEEEKTEKKEEVVETVGETEKPTFYFFRRTGCSHCADLLIYLSNNYKTYSKKFNIVVYDYYQGNNAELVNDVLKALDIDTSSFGFPFYVIGSKSDMGFAESYKESFDAFIDDALASYKKDIVAELISKNKYTDLVKEDIYQAMDYEQIEYEKEGKVKSNDNAVIICIFAGTIIVFGALIFFSKRK